MGACTHQDEEVANVNAQKLRKCALIMGIIMFAALFVSGSHRLIGTTSPVAEPIPLRIVNAYLCSAAAASECIEAHRNQHQEHAVKVVPVQMQETHSAFHGTLSRHADSNGNILFDVSYMRSVYQSFALGDGFV